MHSVVACALCGMDPAADTMLINSAVAAGIAAPWMLRHQLISFARRGYRRLRGIPPEPDSCSLPGMVDDDTDEA
jgi:hypothetical protein